MRMVGGPLLAQGVRTISTATVLLVAVFVAGDSAQAAASSILINELMWAGSTLSASDEWIELYNPTESGIDMSGWLLERAAGSSLPGLTLPVGAAIPAGGHYLITNFEKDHASNAFNVDVEYVTTSLSLLNTANGNIILKDVAGAVVDQVRGDAWPAGETGSIKKSMERGADLTDGLLATSWHSSTETIDQSNFGTPRAANSMPAVNEVPSAVITGASSALVNQVASFSGEDSSDADDTQLTYAWSFGDGGAATGVSVTHTYSAAGIYVVGLTVSDGEAETEAERSITVTAPVYSSDLVINELLPNPAGSDTEAEFIELKNVGVNTVDLVGWQLDDADGGSAPYTIPAGKTVAGGGIISFLRSDTKLALNNSGDSVRLLDPTGAVKSSYVYSSSVPEGQSYNRTSSGSYVISTTLTSGAENVITAPVEEEEEDADDEESSSIASKQAKATGKVAGATATKVNLKDIREEEEGASVTTEGVVSVPPGLFGERIMYLAGSGIQVYFHQATFPEVKLGDTVAVTGELGSSLGEARLKVTSKESVKKIKAGEPPTAHIVETGVIGEDYEGWLVTVQGEVVETSGDTFYVDDGSGEVKIYIKETTHIDKPKMKQGTVVTITGVVSETSSGYRILPRFQEDVRLGRVAGLTSFPATGEFSELMSFPWCAIPNY